MAERDYVVREIKISKDGVFDFDNLYKAIKEWLNFHHYDFFERNYSDMSKGDSKDIKVKFETERKIDSYMKYSIDISISVKDHRLVLAQDKKKKLVKGFLVIGIESVIVTDYDEKWEGKPMKKFIRGIYDKFIEGDKRIRLNNELKEETYGLYNELKAFLNLQRF
jgi:hypothetical protein